MKTRLSILVVMLVSVVVFAANVTTLNTDASSKNGKVRNFWTIQTHDDDEDAIDTMAAGVVRAFGPYGLASGPNALFPSGFAVRVTSITGTTPGVSVDYTTTPTDAYGDTASTINAWTAIDSVTTSGSGFNTYVSLSSKADRFIWFRFNNYDNAAAQIPKNVKITFVEGGTQTAK